MPSYRKYFTSLAPLFCFCSAFADTPETAKNQPPGLESMRTEIRHIENKGVGYNTGYTTLELFIAPCPYRWSVMPFLDLRGHVFDNGRFASNAGFGIRKLFDRRAYGLNAYWDYRDTRRGHYNQVGVGLETLGTFWDLRLNGYLPVGDKTSSPYHIKKRSTVEFETFSGNSAIIRQNTRTLSKQEYAMRGVDAEAAFHVLKYDNFDLVPAIGPYYYQFENKHAIGGRVRLSAQIYQYLSLDLINTYDSRFHENIQGSVGLNIPLGPKMKCSSSRRFKKCADSYLLCERMLQDVYRQEIIVVDKLRRKKFSSKLLTAIDPATNKPYVFYFVDNTSHSSGTFESPFNTLLAAQNAASPGNIIYVFPGDGTSNNTNQGITLSANQALLGAGTAQPLVTTLGTVVIPAMARSMPVVTNNAGPVITLNGDNTLVSGMYIENLNGYGIQGADFNYTTISNNTIIGNNNDGINLQDFGGLIDVNNNAFTQETSGDNYGARLVLTTAHCDATFSDNTFFNYGSGMGGISTELSNTGSIGTLSVTGNTFVGNSGNSQPAINVALIDNSAIGTFNTQDNHSSFCYYGVNAEVYNNSTLTSYNSTGDNFGNYRDGYVGISFDIEGNGSVGSIAIANSVLSSNDSYGASIYSDSTGPIGNITIANTEMNAGSYGLALEFDGTGSVGDILISNCTMNGHVSGAASYLNMNGSSSINGLAFDNCTLTGNTASPGIRLELNNSGSIGSVSISNSNLDNNPNSNFVILAMLNSTGSIGAMNISNCSLKYNNNSYAILADCAGTTGSIGSLTVDNCQLDYSVNGGGVQVDCAGSSTVNNLTVSNTSVTNSQNDFYINLNNATINSIQVFNIDASNTGGFAFTANMSGSTINSLNIDNFVSESADNGIKLVLDSGSTVSNCNLSALSMNGSNNSNVECDGGTIGSLSITNSTLANANIADVYLTSAVSSLTIKDCDFPFNSIGVFSVAATNAAISNNSFTNNLFVGVQMSVGAGSSSYVIDNNTFSGAAVPQAGYGVDITVTGGSLCLDFANNQAMPTQVGTDAPYSFNQTGGTFNLTSDSTQANNIGTISMTGTIGAPGSCTQ